MPNLESLECTEARGPVKQFYSYHFGNDMKPSAENLKLREKYLTTELIQTLAKPTETAIDYFTGTDDYPKAFRLGECRVAEPGKKADIQILLFWKTDTRSEQREIRVETVKQNEGWLINKVEGRK